MDQYRVICTVTDQSCHVVTKSDPHCGLFDIYLPRHLERLRIVQSEYSLVFALVFVLS